MAARRSGGDIHQRHRAGEVHRENHEEEGGKEREEATAILLAEEVLGNPDADEVQPKLDEGLSPAGNDLHPARAEPEDHHDRERRDDADQHDPVQLERSAGEQHDGREELGDRGTHETTTGAAIGGSRQE
jgi:hypothetical protein